MVSVGAGITVTSVGVVTSNEGGLSSEQLTELALDKLISVSNSAPEPIRLQAEAFRENLRNVIYEYIVRARREERSSIVQEVRKYGQEDLAKSLINFT
jgi:hypothetical protein